jgi:trimeric autotransporter adhesin
LVICALISAKRSSSCCRRFLAIGSVVLSALVLTAGSATAAVSSTRNATWVTNGPVRAVLPVGDRVYLGGSFSYLGPVTGSGVPVGRRSGHAVQRFPRVTGDVSAAVSDGEGGYYIGGDFGSAGGLARAGLAHVKADGTVDRRWHPQANGAVYALARSGSTLYLAGDFGKIAGQRRARIGAVATRTGAVTAWDANVASCTDCGATQVKALAVSGSTVYLGGWFTSVHGQERSGLAAVDARTGAVLPWHPAVIGDAMALAASGSMVYVAGSEWVGDNVFTAVGGFDTDRSNDPVWKVRAPSGSSAMTTDVAALAIAGSRLYAGGGFVRIANQARHHLAALDRRTGNVLSWNPAVRGDEEDRTSVDAIAATSSIIYIGGRFTSIGRAERSNIAALSTSSGVASSWMPGTDDPVLAIALSGSTVYVGGDFLSAGGRQRRNLAALDARSGAATRWNPGANGTVYAVAYGSYGIYVGGEFTGIGGRARKNVAVLSPQTGYARGWSAAANRPVYALAVVGPTIYVGGAFTRIAGKARGRLAALGAFSGGVSNWNAGANGEVRAIAISGSRLYLGGMFTRIGGRARSLIAAVDRGSGSVSSWNPGADFQGNCNDRFGASEGCYIGPAVLALSVSGSRVYVGGVFTSIAGKNRGYVAALDAATGAATAWNPETYDYVTAVDAAGTSVYVGGSFGAAELSTTRAKSSGWDPKVSDVQALAVVGTRVYIGCENSYVDGTFTDSGFSSYGPLGASVAPLQGLG